MRYAELKAKKEGRGPTWKSKATAKGVSHEAWDKKVRGSSPEDMRGSRASPRSAMAVHVSNPAVECHALKGQ